MSGIAKPFIPWIGSKEKLIPYIWQVFPPSPKLYLEPFGGGGALLLGMQPKVSRMDIYNDFNCDLVNLFLCARECTVQLVRELKFIPFHSRAEFDLLKEFMKHKELLQQRIADERNAVMECFSGEEREELLEILRERSCLFDVQRAAAYYKVCRGSFSGTTTSFGVKPNNITNFLYLFDDASKRLQDVVTVLVSRYKANGLASITESHYHGNHRNLSYAEEEALLEPFRQASNEGKTVSVHDIETAYREAVGHSIGTSQIYYVLHRHGWRKVMPRSKHPKKASDEVIETSKKLTSESAN